MALGGRLTPFRAPLKTTCVVITALKTSSKCSFTARKLRFFACFCLVLTASSTFLEVPFLADVLVELFAMSIGSCFASLAPGFAHTHFAFIFSHTILLNIRFGRKSGTVIEFRASVSWKLAPGESSGVLDERLLGDDPVVSVIRWRHERSGSFIYGNTASLIRSFLIGVDFVIANALANDRRGSLTIPAAIASELNRSLLITVNSRTGLGEYLAQHVVVLVIT